MFIRWTARARITCPTEGNGISRKKQFTASSESRCPRPPTSQNVLTTFGKKQRAERKFGEIGALGREFSSPAVLSGSPYGRWKWGGIDTDPPRKCLETKEKARELGEKSPGLRLCRMRVNQPRASSERRSEWLPKSVQTTPAERSLLVRLGSPLGSAIRDILGIVHYKTFLRWVREEELHTR